MSRQTSSLIHVLHMADGVEVEQMNRPLEPTSKVALTFGFCYLGALPTRGKQMKCLIYFFVSMIGAPVVWFFPLEGTGICVCVCSLVRVENVFIVLSCAMFTGACRFIKFEGLSNSVVGCPFGAALCCGTT